MSHDHDTLIIFHESGVSRIHHIRCYWRMNFAIPSTHRWQGASQDTHVNKYVFERMRHEKLETEMRSRWVLLGRQTITLFFIVLQSAYICRYMIVDLSCHRKNNTSEIGVWGNGEVLHLVWSSLLQPTSWRFIYIDFFITMLLLYLYSRVFLSAVVHMVLLVHANRAEQIFLWP